MPTQHNWTFSLIGGVKRVNLDSGADLLALRSLDQKLWTALSCPVNGLETDARTLELIDQDHDGQIRVPEILNAVEWITSLLKDPGQLLKQEAVFPLDAIDTTKPEGSYLLQCAQIILQNLGKAGATALTVEDTSDFTRIFAATAFNGDGVITEDSTSDALLQQWINTIAATMGTLPDRSGKSGISKHHITDFFAACRSCVAWEQEAVNNTSLLPLGEHTASAYALIQQLTPKVKDYFLRCSLAAFDPEGADALNHQQAQLLALAGKDLQDSMEEISKFTLSRIAPNKPLSVKAGVNPFWSASLRQLATLVKPLLDADTWDESQWDTLVQRFSAFAEWQGRKPNTQVENLGSAMLHDALNSAVEAQLQELLDKDLALEDEANSMILVDKLVRYHRDLFQVLKNFVTFKDFYTPGTKAIFQAGTLYIDQRSLELCILVNDMDKHDAMAGLSGMYLIYCKCKSRASSEEITIVAALTNGDIDNMIVGRNAVFYDRKGNDWDATVIKLIDNPISIRQAFWTPYRKVSRFIEQQVNKFAASQDDKVTSHATGTIEKRSNDADAQVTQAVTTGTVAPAPAPAPAFDIGKFVGIFAAISLALGAIGTALASIVAGFMALTWWKMPLAIAGLLLLISGPSMIMAYLKLRKRNLAPLLDANGWAINARANVNIRFGNLLTQIATLPENARVNYDDPFRKKGIAPWKILVIVVIATLIMYYALRSLGWF